MYPPTRWLLRLIPVIALLLFINSIWHSQVPLRVLEEPTELVDQTKADANSFTAPPETKDSILHPRLFRPLRTGSIKPEGWMKDQMRLMAAGLPGHLFDFYGNVANSTWLGGDQEYSGLNEGLPYWLNGLVPLAYAIDDARLKSQIRSAVTHIISQQAEDGWLGPEQGNQRILWGRFPLFLAFMQLVEADDSYTDLVIPAMHRFNKKMLKMLQNNKLGYVKQPNDNYDDMTFMWGQARAADMAVALQWMYEHHPMNQSEELLSSMLLLREGALNWQDFYTPDKYIPDDVYTVPKQRWQPLFPFLHAVNVAQGLKAAAVWYRVTHQDELKQAAIDSVRWIMRDHAGPAGSIIGDERLGGLSPWSGSELCTTVEAIYSLSYLYTAFGKDFHAERAELAAFNALPAAISPDWWSHQYMTQLNQPFSRALDPNPFFNVNKFAQTYGLEPHFPCCTVNGPQGFPKYLAGSWVQMGSNGVGHGMLGPSSIEIQLAVGRVTIKCTTNYPFSGRLFYTINAPAPFDFFVRIPSWADATSSFVKDTRLPYALEPHPDTRMHHMRINFRGITNVIVDLRSRINPHPRNDDTIVVHHGPVLYALDVVGELSNTPPMQYNGESLYQPSGHMPIKVKDWRITNLTKWNIAIDPNTVRGHSIYPDAFNSDGSSGFGIDPVNHPTEQPPLKNPIFTSGAPPIWMTANACEIDWPLDGGIPRRPPPLEKRKCIGNVFEAKLIPYGAAKLHMAEIPSIDLSPGSSALPFRGQFGELYEDEDLYEDMDEDVLGSPVSIEPEEKEGDIPDGEKAAEGSNGEKEAEGSNGEKVSEGTNGEKAAEGPNGAKEVEALNDQKQDGDKKDDAGQDGGDKKGGPDGNKQP